MSGSLGGIKDQYGTETYYELESRDYPFKLEYIGVGVSEGVPKVGHGLWETTAGKIALDGTLQDIWFKVPFNHRPVRLLLYHIDAQAAPSSAAYSWWLEYESRASYGEVPVWLEYASGVANGVTELAEFGETWETLLNHYRLRIIGPDGHYVFPSFRVQKIKESSFKTQRDL